MSAASLQNRQNLIDLALEFADIGAVLVELREHLVGRAGHASLSSARTLLWPALVAKYAQSLWVSLQVFGVKFRFSSRVFWSQGISRQGLRSRGLGYNIGTLMVCG